MIKPRHHGLLKSWVKSAAASTCLLVRRFKRNRRGVAAIEFAYIAPFMMLAMVGTLEASRAIAVHKRFQRATDMMADLIAREKAIGTDPTSALDALGGMMRAINHIMTPYDTSSFKLGVVSVRASSTNPNSSRVDWSYSYKGTSVPPRCDTYAMPGTGMLSTGGSAIVVSSSYVFNPLLVGIVPGFNTSMSWSDKVSYSTRNSCVNYGGQGCLLTCPGGWSGG